MMRGIEYSIENENNYCFNLNFFPFIIQITWKCIIEISCISLNECPIKLL